MAEDKVGQPACQGQMKPLGNCENAEGIGKAILTYDPKTKLKSFLKVRMNYCPNFNKANYSNLEDNHFRDINEYKNKYSAILIAS